MKVYNEKGDELLTEEELLERFKERGFALYKVEEKEKKLKDEPEVGDYVKGFDLSDAVVFGRYEEYDQSDEEEPYRVGERWCKSIEKITKEQYEQVQKIN